MTPNIKSRILVGDFPIEDDTVLIVRYRTGRQYFTGKMPEILAIAGHYTLLSVVCSVEIVPIGEFL